MTNDENLSREQEAAVQYMLRPESDGAALLAFDMGLGKTRTGLMFVREYKASTILICVPLQTMDDWAKEAAVQLPNLPVRIIKSKPGSDKIENLAAFQWRESGIYLITHQYWEKLAWVLEPVKKRRKTDPDRTRKVDSGVWGGPGYTLIFDESHRSANVDSWTHKALMNIDPRVFKLSMSGTFMGDKFDGAYGATRWLWPHRTDIIPGNIFSWRKIWAETAYDPFAPRKEKVVGELSEGAFVSALPCYIRMESDLPKPIVHELKIDLYPEQRRVYDELDDLMVAWIENNPLEVEYSITKRARQRQTTLAMPTLTFAKDPETGIEELESVSFADDAESAKIDRLMLEIEGKGSLGDLLAGEALLILTDSQLFARLLTMRLNDKYGYVAREWSGKVTKPQRKIVKQQFIDGEIQFLVGVQAAMGTGTDGLQHASHIVVMMSKADRRIDNEQGIARLNRKGQTKQVHLVNMIANDTVDTGQHSKQMEDALKMQRSLKAKHRKEQRELERQRRVHNQLEQ